jgi:2-polyprenyl-3-methyl-5-hydroxy-6-metoxy-1,4-benzoquinol methylase
LGKDIRASAKNYVAYESMVTDRHLVPLFLSKRVPLDRPVLDVGCGMGGTAIKLAEALSLSVTGIDISESYIATAREAAADANAPVRFHRADVLRDELPAGPYGLIVMHDVVEHLPQPEIALKRLLPLSEDGGLLYVSFPPWLGPYAGHHHTCASALRFMPYLHAVAPWLLLKLAHRWEEKDQEWFADLRTILETRLSMRKFERMAYSSGWKIRYARTYLLRPEFLRMGLPKMSNGWIGRIPWVGELFTTGCEYLLEPRLPRSGTEDGLRVS